MKRKLTVVIDSNRVTCGECHFLRDGTGAESTWWCLAFDQSLGYQGHMKTPNRHEQCLEAEGLPGRKKR